MKFLGKASQNNNYYLAFDEDGADELNPFDDDNLWTLFSFDSDIEMDKHIDSLDDLQDYFFNKKDIKFSGSLDDFKENCIEKGLSEDEFFDALENKFANNGLILRPINDFNHDSHNLSICVHNPYDAYGFDDGVIGVAVVSKDKLRKKIGSKYITKKIKRTALSILNNELNIINDWLDGNIYGIVIKNDDGDEKDSCWGIYGTDISNAKNKLNFAETII